MCLIKGKLNTSLYNLTTINMSGVVLLIEVNNI